MNGDETFWLVLGIVFGIVITVFALGMASQKVEVFSQKSAVFEDACNKSCNKIYKVNYMHVERDYWCMCKNGKVLKRDLNLLYQQ